MRIAFLHHALRNYRQKLFEMLASTYDIRFYFSFNSRDSDFSGMTGKYEMLDEYRNPLYTGRFCPSIIPRLIIYNPDVIIASTLTSFFTHFSFLYSRLFRRRFIVFMIDWKWMNGFSGWLSLLMARLILTKCDAVVVGGTKSLEFAKRHGARAVFVGMNSALDLSEMPIDNDRLSQMHSRFEGKKVILYLSRIVKTKGLDVLLKAFSILEKKRNDCFLLIGGDGDFRPQCEKIAKRLDLRNYEFLGSVSPSETVYYYLRCDVFVLPSRFMPDLRSTNEPWGLVINEAMSVSKPVVSTTAVGAAYDLIIDGVNGYQVEAGDSSKLARAINLVLNHPEYGPASRRIVERANVENQFQAFARAIDTAVRK